MSLIDHPIWVQLSDGVITVDISFSEAQSYTQAYEIIAGRSIFRTLDGTAVKQQNWTKLKTTLSGGGALPIGLGGLDFTLPVTLKCGAARKVASTSNVIAIPANRRAETSHAPFAFKYIDGIPYATTLSLAGNLATIPVDPSAQGYSVSYYPEIEVIMNEPSESRDLLGGDSQWSLTAEER